MERTESTGRMVGAARVLLGYSQAELAGLAGLAAATISNVEAGRSEPRPATMKAIRRVLKRSGLTAQNDTLNGNIVLSFRYDVDDD